jgi:SAM-dependent methyltransferase
MELNRADLDMIERTTLAHYNLRADAFLAGTRDHDVSQNIDALLRHIDGSAPFDILDFGCGPGRDLARFTALGHRAVGLDGSEPFVAMARAATGCEVWHQHFLALICHRSASTACSRMPRCSTCRRRSCRACCANCGPR